MDTVEAFKTLQAVMITLRAATGDMALGHSVSDGGYRLVRVTYGSRGISNVETIREPLPLEEHIADLRARIKEVSA